MRARNLFHHYWELRQRFGTFMVSSSAKHTEFPYNKQVKRPAILQQGIHEFSRTVVATDINTYFGHVPESA